MSWAIHAGRLLISAAISVPWATPLAGPDVIVNPADQTQAAPQLLAMPSDANPAFEVATIKPSDTSAPHGTVITTHGRHVIAFNISVGDLIAYAYGLHAKQIVDGPSSLLNAHFDIDGLPDVQGHPNLKQTRLLFQKLLISRFGLTFHSESRELSVYAVEIAKGGPKLTVSTRKPGDSTNFSYTRQIVLSVRNASMSDFAKGMQETFMDKPVIDRTGLNERYDFDLKWMPDEYQSYGPRDPEPSRSDPDTPPGLYTAIQEQLGLKLVPTRAPAYALVIDHIEQPSSN